MRRNLSPFRENHGQYGSDPRNSWKVVPVFREHRKPLILRGHLDVVDDEALNGATATFDLEAEAVHHAEDGGDTVVVLRIIGRQIVVVRARDSGLVEDGKLKIVIQSNSKIVGRCVGALRFPVPDITHLAEHDGPGIRSRVFGRLELKRPAAPAKDVDLTLFHPKVIFETEAVAKEALKHEALFGGWFRVPYLDIARG